MREVLRERAIVLSNQTSPVPRLVLSLQPQDACDTCPASSLCTNSAGERQLELNRKSDLEPGERVWIEIRAAKVLLASLLVYGLPLLMFCLGILAGMSFLDISSPSIEFFSFLIGLLLAAIVYFFVWLADKKRQSTEAGDWLDIRILEY